MTRKGGTTYPCIWHQGILTRWTWVPGHRNSQWVGWQHRLALGRLEEQHPTVGHERLVLPLIQSDFHVFLPCPRGVEGRFIFRLGDAQVICHATHVRAGRIEPWRKAQAAQIYLASELLGETKSESNARILSSRTATTSWNCFEDLVLGP